MKKGLLGCNLANQVIVIGIAFSVSVPFTSWTAIKNFSSEIYNCSSQALSLMGIIFGFLLVSHPEKFSGVQQTSYETMPTGVATGWGAKIGVFAFLSIVKVTSKKITFCLIISNSIIKFFQFIFTKRTLLLPPFNWIHFPCWGGTKYNYSTSNWLNWHNQQKRWNNWGR